jgi:hypothetical protein
MALLSILAMKTRLQEICFPLNYSDSTLRYVRALKGRRFAIPPPASHGLAAGLAHCDTTYPTAVPSAIAKKSISPTQRFTTPPAHLPRIERYGCFRISLRQHFFVRSILPDDDEARTFDALLTDTAMMTLISFDASHNIIFI